MSESKRRMIFLVEDTTRGAEDDAPTKPATRRALEDPQVGDHWSEMTTYHIFVTQRNGDRVTSMSYAPPCEVPADGEKHVDTLDEFRVRVSSCLFDGNRLYYAKLHGYKEHPLKP